MRVEIARAELAESRVAFLAEVSGVLASSLEYGATLKRAADLAVPMLADLCWIGLLRPGPALEWVATASSDPETLALYHEIAERFPSDPELDPLAEILRFGEPAVIDATAELIAASSRSPEHRELLEQAVAGRQLLIVPLIARESRLGVIVLMRQAEGGRFCEQDVQLARLFASRAAVAIENARLHQQAREAEANYRLLFEHAPHPRWIYDVETLAFLKVNEAAVRHYGYSAEEFAGMTIKDIRPPEDLPRLLDTVRREIDGLRETEDWRHIRKDGSAIRVNVAAHDVEFEGRRARHAVILDVTARKQAEEELLRLNQELEQRIEERTVALAEANRSLELQYRRAQEATRLKSEFLANMSHELRTPLNGIIGFTELILDGKAGPLTDDQQEFLDDVLASGRHLLQLINDVLDLSKVEAGRVEFRPEPVELGRLAAEVRDILRAVAAQKRIRVHLEADGELEAVLDPAKFKQVLYNYLSNALKFTPDEGEVWIRLRAESGGKVRLEVEDTGIGIRAEDMHRLFVEFEQLESGYDKQHSGTGLGLALSKRLVEAQGGRVEVRSTPGAGSVFAAVLPRHTSEAVSAGEPAQPDPDAPDRAGATVLVIEDEARDRRWLTTTLQQAGYVVVPAASGEEARDLCRQRRFDAITLDLILPDGSGWELLHEIRNDASGLNAEIPVVVVTVVAERESGLGFAIHDYLPKPVDSATLVASLRRAGVHPLGRGPAVLVVDDDAVALRLMDATLGSAGYRPVCTASAASALGLAEADPPRAVILDLMLPGMDGFEFLEQFRLEAVGATTPVIVWTNKDLSRAEMKRLKASAQGVVLKSDGGVSRLLQELERHLPRELQGAHARAGGVAALEAPEPDQ